MLLTVLYFLKKFGGSIPHEGEGVFVGDLDLVVQEAAFPSVRAGTFHVVVGAWSGSKLAVLSVTDLAYAMSKPTLKDL